MYRLYYIIIFLLYSATANAQEILKLKITDQNTNAPLSGVTITEKGKAIGMSDKAGYASISLPPGNHTLGFTSVGYDNATFSFTLPDTLMHDIRLNISPQKMEDVTIIASTRNNQRMENSAVKVEVLGREEMEEESNIKPASIASILGDISGIQIQQSSVVSGNANVRIQGLEGRYTQILRDGMPLYDGFSGGFGVLSIPPLDLKQVELIKGSASTLYGGGAIGGLVNIISKKPTNLQELIVSVNRSTLKENNLNLYAAKKYRYAGYTLFAGYTKQAASDVGGDGFSDLPDLNAFVLHPRLFFYPNKNTTIITGYTLTTEQRSGGDMLVLNGYSDNIHQYHEKNKTLRNSFELMAERELGSGKKLSLKGSFSSFIRSIESNIHYFKGGQQNYFAELSILIPYKKNSFVAGINFSGDNFKIKPSDPVMLTDFSNNTIGCFVQNTWHFNNHLNIETGIREDIHPQYGSFFLPSISGLYRFNEHWAFRAGVGLGYKIPNPLSVDNKEYDIQYIAPLMPEVSAEHSAGYNAEFNYKTSWGNEHELFINHALFLTHITRPVISQQLPDNSVHFLNPSGSIETKGSDTYIRAVIDEWEIYAGYTFCLAERKYLPSNDLLPLTPVHRFAFTLVKEFNDKWKMGLEGSYNGPQRREDNSKTPGYFFAAALLQLKPNKHITIVLNAENLFNYRQDKEEALYQGTITHPKFNALWAPIDGRVVNLSVKYRLSLLSD
jgi:iron complex outermembrane receptor protein/outer membrane receptor for ferrienterochelin and colicins